MKKELTFHIDNLAYSFNIDNKLEQTLIKFLSTEKNIETRELLLAYIRLGQEHTLLKNELEKISDLLPDV